MKKIYFSIYALFIIPHLNQAVDVTVDYLCQLDKYVENVKMNYTVIFSLYLGCRDMCVCLELSIKMLGLR